MSQKQEDNLSSKLPLKGARARRAVHKALFWTWFTTAEHNDNAKVKQQHQLRQMQTYSKEVTGK